MGTEINMREQNDKFSRMEFILVHITLFILLLIGMLTVLIEAVKSLLHSINMF